MKNPFDGKTNEYFVFDNNAEKEELLHLLKSFGYRLPRVILTGIDSFSVNNGRVVSALLGSRREDVNTIGYDTYHSWYEEMLKVA